MINVYPFIFYPYIIRNSYMKESILLSLRTKPPCIVFWLNCHIGWFYTYKIYETLIGKYVFRFDWAKNHLDTSSNSRDILADLAFFFVQKKAIFSHFCLDIRNIWKTNGKMHIPSQMTYESSCYDHPFSRYRILADLAILAKFSHKNCDIKNGTGA